MTAGVSVATLLGARGAAIGLNLDLLAGAAGLERRITLPYVQKRTRQPPRRHRCAGSSRATFRA